MKSIKDHIDETSEEIKGMKKISHTIYYYVFEGISGKQHFTSSDNATLGTTSPFWLQIGTKSHDYYVVDKDYLPEIRELENNHKRSLIESLQAELKGE